MVVRVVVQNGMLILMAVLHNQDQVLVGTVITAVVQMLIELVVLVAVVLVQ
jgi:hypothetical protein